MIRNDLVRDHTISPECRWLLTYLLTSDEYKQTIKISKIVNHVKGFWSRDKVYKIIKEAVNAGYMKKDEFNEALHHVCIY